MRSIIVPTDFSRNSIYAAYYAADLAAMIGAQLHLLYVFTLSHAVSEILVHNNVEQADSDIEAKMKKLKTKITAYTGGRIKVISAIRSGIVVNEISEYCSSVKPFAVVMGAESTDPFERIIFGGKALSGIKKLPWPLIIIPTYTVFKNIRKIGLAIDFREVVKSVRVNEIIDIVSELKAELHILHITNETGASFHPATSGESGFLQEMFRDLQPKFHFINEARIEKGLSDFAEKNKIDLLIIVPKKHSVIDQLFHHSHSKRLVLHEQIPVMSLHE